MDGGTNGMADHAGVRIAVPLLLTRSVCLGLPTFGKAGPRGVEMVLQCQEESALQATGMLELWDRSLGLGQRSALNLYVAGQ